MKKILIIYSVAAFFAICFTILSCKETNCNPGYKVSDDCKCYCPPGEKFEAKNICKVLAAEEYWGYSNDCACQDTTFFSFTKPTFNPDFGREEVTMTKTYGPIGQNKRNITFVYNKQNGREYLESSGILAPGCPVEGFTSQTRFFAEYLPTDTIRLFEIQETTGFSPRRDTCVWYLHK